MTWPTAYAPTPAQPPAPQPNGGPDATADFAAVLNDPRRWKIKTGVPIFKAHQRTDPNTGKLISVDLPKLYRIAANMQQLERSQGVPVRTTLGHTEPGKPETEQPPVAGYYRNARVAPFGPNQEPAVVADEWLDPQYGNMRKNFPYRSAEYYDDTEQITGVALLTRDPFLDLGVVAYSRFDPSNSGLMSYTAPSRVPLLYAAAGQPAPTMYNLVLGERPMWPQTPQPQMPGAPAYVAPPPAPLPGYGVPQAVAPTPYAAQPQFAGPPMSPAAFPTPFGATTGFAPPAPTPYAYPQPAPAPYSGGWPGPAYRPHQIGHQHQSGGAVYGRGGYPRRSFGRPAPYADDDMPPGGGGGGPGGPPPGGPGGGGAPGDVIGQAAEGLMQIAQLLMSVAGGDPGMGGAPQAPMPPQGGGGPPTMASRYQPRGGARRYSNPNIPVGYTGGANPQRPISGLPVGYQLQVDKLAQQNQQLNQALKVLYYERDQSDTEWCASEIRRLHSLGYDVGEFEFNELKNRPKELRYSYLEHIATKYSQVPSGGLPPAMPGDPTPMHEQAPTDGRMTREQMDALLKATEGNEAPASFQQAVNYMRTGGNLNNPAAFGQQPAEHDPYAALAAYQQMNGQAR